MSETVNYSLKIDIEQRDLLQKKIAESEMTAGNFLGAMLANYEATQSRESLSDVREINQVKNHLARIEEIYIGLAKSRQDAEGSHDHSIAALKEQLVLAKAQLMDTQAASKAEVEAITKQMKELTEKAVQENRKNMVESADLKQQKEMAEEGQRQAVKIANLTEQTLRQVQDQVAEFKNKDAISRQRAEQAINKLDQTTIELNTSRQELTILKNQLQKQTETSKRSLEDQHQRSELDRQKAILSAQQASLVKRESLQDEIVRLRDQLSTERERALQALLNSKTITDQKEVNIMHVPAK